MAIEQNKNDQTLSVEQRLRALYELQTILSEIDRIKTIPKKSVTWRTTSRVFTPVSINSKPRSKTSV